MILEIVCIALFIGSIYVGIKDKFSAFSMLSIAFFGTWLLQILVQIPYLYPINSIIILGMVISTIRSRIYMALLPLLFLRLSQILHIQGKYVSLLIMVILFGLIITYLIISERKLFKDGRLLLAIGAFAIEVLNYFI